MSAATLTGIGMPRTMTARIKLVLVALSPVAGWWALSSFDVVSYGAGFTNVSLRTFALATLFGMAPPTFVFTYLGSSIVSAQWSLIAAGAGMVLFFLVMPRF